MRAVCDVLCYMYLLFVMLRQLACTGNLPRYDLFIQVKKELIFLLFFISVMVCIIKDLKYPEPVPLLFEIYERYVLHVL